MNPLLTDYADILENLRSEGRLRSLKPADEADCGLLDCTSNDYMAIGRDRALAADFAASLDPDSRIWGSCASRLLYTGPDNSLYTALENLLEDAYGRPALIFNSGYHANTGIIPALAIPGTLIVADKLVHASAIDGIRLSGVPFRRFRHNDMEALGRILDKEAHNYRRVLVVVEGIYSMDGDRAPVKALVEHKKRHDNVMLYIDEAHSFGVAGTRGLGVCEEEEVMDDVDIIVATLSKAVASVGAFAITGSTLKQYLVNNCRSLIFSTAIPPVSVAWSHYVIRHLMGMERERERLRSLGRRLSRFIASLDGEAPVSDSAIVPLMVPGNERVMAASRIMKSCGVMALPIRRPTVAAGAERLRISLNAAMTDADMTLLENAVKRVYEELEL